jgi:hypothetical protein
MRHLWCKVTLRALGHLVFPASGQPPYWMCDRCGWTIR